MSQSGVLILDERKYAYISKLQRGVFRILRWNVIPWLWKCSTAIVPQAMFHAECSTEDEMFHEMKIKKFFK